MPCCFSCFFKRKDHSSEDSVKNVTHKNNKKSKKSKKSRKSKKTNRRRKQKMVDKKKGYEMKKISHDNKAFEEEIKPIDDETFRKILVS